MTVSVMAPAAAGLSGTQDVTLTDDKADIHSSLQDVEGTEMVVLRLEEPSTSMVKAQGPSALKQHAEASQQQVKMFADQSAGIEVVNSFWITNAVLVEVNTNKVDLNTLARLRNVEELHANFEASLPEQPEPESATDGKTAQVGPQAVDTTYGLDQIDAPEVWDEFGTKGEGARVAVLDTGVDADHPDIELADNGWAEIGDDGEPVQGSEPFDSDEHGTHVSGTVSGGDASGEYIGVAPNVELMHGLVLNGGRGSFATIVGGMEWAVENNADVISMSLGGEGYSDAYIDPVRNAQDSGTVVIVASGNSGEGTSGSPGNVYDALAVGATNSNEQITDFSSGEEVNTQSAWGSAAPSDWPSTYIVPDVSAPGQNVKSSVPGGDYKEFPGTSMATPHVSGVAALMISAAGEDLSPDQIQQTLIDTSFKPSNAPSEQDTRWGHGIVDAFEAVSAVAGSPGPSVEGQVVDQNGDAVDGATVELGSAASTTTDSSGSFSLSADAGTYTLTVSGDLIQEGASKQVTLEGEQTTDAGTLTVETVPTTDIGLVGGDFLGDIESTLNSQLDGQYTFTTVSSASEASNYDALVVESLDGVDAQAFVDATSGADTGVVYLDQWNNDNPGATAIKDLTSTSLVSSTDQTDSYSGDASTPIVYEPQTDHPILDGISGETDIHSAEYADHSWFQADGFETLATVGYDSTTSGPALAVDEDSATVLAATLGYSEYVSPSDFTSDASAILANAVEYAASQEDAPSGPNLGIASADAPAEVNVGDQISPSVTIENTGDEAGSTTVTFSFDGTELGSQDVSVAAGATETVSFSAQAPSTAGTYDWTITAAGESLSDTLEVVDDTTEPASFQITSADAPSEVNAGDQIAPSVTIENTGGEAGSTTVTFDVEGQQVDSASVSLDAGQSQTVSLSTQAPSSAGSYGWTVATGDDSVSGQVDVVESGELPPVTGSSPPQDLDNDGYYEDVNGDGVFSIADVNALYYNLYSPAVQNNPEAFNFDLATPASVSYSDVQALYDYLMAVSSTGAAPAEMPDAGSDEAAVSP
jgi:subtilisin family serine protease